MRSPRALIIFAREPAKGKVKTRLSRHLDPARVMALYRAFLQDTVKMARQVDCEQRILAYTGGQPRYLRKIAGGFVFWRQEGAGLGERMLAATRFSCREIPGSRPVIIGTDAPHVPAARVNHAFRALKSHDLALGPALDGGFYLIGMQRIIPGLFDRVVWSSDRVMTQTLQNAVRRKLRFKLLAGSYDIDQVQDLERLRQDLTEQPGLAPATFKLLRQG